MAKVKVTPEEQVKAILATQKERIKKIQARDREKLKKLKLHLTKQREERLVSAGSELSKLYQAKGTEIALDAVLSICKKYFEGA